MGKRAVDVFNQENLPTEILRHKYAWKKPADNTYHKVLYPYDKKERSDGSFTYKWLCQCCCGEYFGTFQVKGKSTCPKCNSNLIGRKFNLLTVLHRVNKDETINRAGEYYLCKCDCGKLKITNYRNLTSGDVKSCGCLKRAVPLYDKTNTIIEHKAGIYMFQNVINGHNYVGKTKDLYNRYWQHKHRRDGKHEGREKQLHQAFDKYGFDNFNYIILEKFEELPSKELLSEREEFYIKKYDCYKNGYNASEISSGGFVSEEHKEKCTQVLNDLNSRQKGLNHPRSKISKEELDEIYSYAMRGAPAGQAWELLKNKLEGKLTHGAFTQVYLGTHYSELVPDGWEFRPKVYSGSIFWGEDIIDMRKRFLNGETADEIYQDYKEKCPQKSTFLSALKGKTYKKIIVS